MPDSRYEILTADLGLGTSQVDDLRQWTMASPGYRPTPPPDNPDAVFLIWSPVGYCEFCGVLPGTWHKVDCSFANDLKWDSLKANMPKYYERDHYEVERG